VHPHGKPLESGEDYPTLDINILRATVFNDLLACNETNETFTLRIREHSGLLGETIEDTTSENPGEIEPMNPKCWTREQGAAAVVAAEEHLQILQ
jgi:hypothetical protein